MRRNTQFVLHTVSKEFPFRNLPNKFIRMLKVIFTFFVRKTTSTYTHFLSNFNKIFKTFRYCKNAHIK
ncbi:hypothetical protein Y883_21160 [Luteibacter rhizovicinus DSM 16549]|nr:hypothetical protein Y883_21160 [Luteibacter rhizovicinus DSM 16549]